MKDGQQRKPTSLFAASVTPNPHQSCSSLAFPFHSLAHATSEPALWPFASRSRARTGRAPGFVFVGFAEREPGLYRGLKAFASNENLLLDYRVSPRLASSPPAEERGRETRTAGCSLAAETEKSRSLGPDCAGPGLMTELTLLTRVCINAD